MKVVITIDHMKSEFCPDLIFAVDYMGRNYGGGTPCRNEVDVHAAIERKKQHIRQAGDTPIIVDKRIKQMDLFGAEATA